MKTRIQTIATAAASLIGFAIMVSSCDSTAGDIKFSDLRDEYLGQFTVGLYVPEAGIENLDECVVPSVGKDTLKCIYSDDGTATIIINNIEDLHFRLPFLDEDGNVLELFKDGTFAKLYARLQDAHEKGMLTDEEFNNFKKEVSTICDTITISGINTTKIPITTYGAVVGTYDWEQNSPYVRFGIHNVDYKRRSNLFHALKSIQGFLSNLATNGLLTETEMQELIKIREQQANSISDGSGWGILSTSNARVDVELHLETATNLLDNLSVALFGRKADGQPAKELWAVIGFKGVWDGSGNYERLDD